MDKEKNQHGKSQNEGKILKIEGGQFYDRDEFFNHVVIWDQSEIGMNDVRQPRRIVCDHRNKKQKQQTRSNEPE